MNGNRTVMVEILNAIEYGTLSVDETRRRLEELIDKEIQKSDAPADMQLVGECEKLLWELNTNGKIPFVSHLEENQSAVLKRSKRQQNILSLQKKTFRIVTIAAAICVLAIGIEALLHKEWLVWRSTADEQQLIVHGQEFDPGTVKGVNAESNQNPDTLSTDEYVKAVNFLGFDPHMDFSLEQGWTVEQYTCSRFVDDLTLYIDYLHQDGNTIRISAVFYNDIKDAVMYLEQNSDGEQYQQSGRTLYLTRNYDRIIATWNEKNVVYTLRSSSTLHDTIQFINSIFEVD